VIQWRHRTAGCPLEGHSGFEVIDRFSFHQLSSAIGIFYLALLDIFCGWRLLTVFAALIQLLDCLFVFLIPESPAVERTEALIVKESIFQRK
jgi:hypothetical protein